MHTNTLCNTNTQPPEWLENMKYEYILFGFLLGTNPLKDKIKCTYFICFKKLHQKKSSYTHPKCIFSFFLRMLHTAISSYPTTQILFHRKQSIFLKK